MKALYYFLTLAALMVLIAGCSSKTEQAETADHHEEGHVHTLANGDLQETTSSIKDMPSFLEDKDDQMKAVYLAAAQHPDILEFMPCYCGCGDSAGHKSNLNCFAAEITEEKIVWDDHGTRCAVCLEIAAESILMKEDGHSLKEIRQHIDQKYGEGYAKPTPTPMPA
ncbi:PCYCGC motif-containing (lipo)protein [Bacillus thermotolerans]|uniref:Lipoprotein n=1 Tax=Bacillus thermotolerans TaxID=1221996 RepID=A0A0F5HWF8_BACTR|nr:PCYCGC motif-containing (lipo)protein [Bacillus thermotolerans]KKB33364.1 hypothetical protein QY96_00596 [Bacillus thermotolerans]KKB37719.1 hypothetical protein QY95_02829 [Bacillus thermotolerans]KKB38534.1 hypothetical protein QY97_02443 [Bacillus thermotolerans]